MTQSLMEKVESFLAKLVKRALKWPKHLSNTAVLVVRSRILERKLGFLQHVLSLACVCCVPVWGVKECRKLDEVCGVMLTERMLKGEPMWNRSLKEEIRIVDHNLLAERCTFKALLIEVEDACICCRLNTVN